MIERENPDQGGSRPINRSFVKALAVQLPLAAYALRHAGAGEPILRAGDRPAMLPLIESGAVDAVLQIGDQGDEVIPISFAEGELALMSSLFSSDPVHVDLVAAGDVALRWLPIADLEACVLKSPDLLVQVVRFLAQRLREVQSRERGWLARSVRERVRVALARMTREARPDAEGRLRIVATHAHIAARCGVSRPKLSHELKRLEMAGSLKLYRGRIEVVDTSAFGAFD